MFGYDKSMICPAGEWTTVVHTMFAQIPVRWTIQATGGDGGDGPSDALIGDFEESASAWIFPGRTTQGPIQAEMVFRRGYWNTFYKIRIRPQKTLSVRVRRGFA